MTLIVVSLLGYLWDFISTKGAFLKLDVELSIFLTLSTSNSLSSLSCIILYSSGYFLWANGGNLLTGLNAYYGRMNDVISKPSGSYKPVS